MQLPPAAEIGEGISTDLYEFLQAALRVKREERPSVAPLIQVGSSMRPTTCGSGRRAGSVVNPPDDILNLNWR